jgi:hypothetical protein
MSKYSHGWLFIKALIFSLALNLIMIVAGLSGGAPGQSTLLTRLSDLFVAPPGIIIMRCCVPQQHTSGALLSSIFEAAGVSIFFYGLAAWLILELIYWGKRWYALRHSTSPVLNGDCTK